VTLAAASVLSGRLGLSAIPIFIVLGIVLLLFFLGLEFSLGRLTAARRMVVVGGVVDLVVNGGLGLAVGIALLGLGPEAVLLAGLIYISSSGIVTRALFDLRRLGDDETDLVLGILVFEDLAIAVFLGVAAALATGESVGGLEVAATAGLALGFVGAFLVLGRWAHHAFDRIGPRLDREQLLLGALAIAIGGGALGEAAGLSEAVGALLAGILLSGSEVRDQIEQQLLGLRDFAAAIFFFAFGLEVDLAEAGDAAPWLVLAVPVAVAGKVVAGYVAGRATGFSRRQSVNVGSALVARGEFTIILAGLAAAGAALDAEFRGLVEPFAGLFVLATAVIGVVLMRESRRIGRLAFPTRAARRESRR
jgi:monovalent cation:H+ antiporter-2, CPA2 family